MGNRLESFLGRNRTSPSHLELTGEFLTKEIGRNEFALRDFIYQGCHGRRTGQQHFSRTTKEFYAVLGDVDDHTFLGFHIVFFASVLLSSKPRTNAPGMTRYGCLDAYGRTPKGREMSRSPRLKATAVGRPGAAFGPQQPGRTPAGPVLAGTFRPGTRLARFLHFTVAYGG